MTDPEMPRAPPVPARRLLVLSCSSRKRPDAGLLSAVDRYEGPAVRVLRRFLAAADPPGVLVLSAEYGLIPAARPIPGYDRRLTPDAADALRPGVLRALGEALAGGAYAEVAFCLGWLYCRSVAGRADVVPDGTAVAWVACGHDTRLRNLRAWLLGAGPPAS